jgi:hypothetical protein
LASGAFATHSLKQPMISFNDISPWVWIALVAGAVALYLVLRSRYHFTITIHGESVEISGTFPAAKRAVVVGFFQRDIHLPGRVKIHGRRRPDRRLDLVIRGRLDAGERQRIRNFLLDTL